MAHIESPETRRIERAAAIIAAGRDQRDTLSIGAAAEIAWTAGGPSVHELTELIARQRATRAA